MTLNDWGPHTNTFWIGLETGRDALKFPKADAADDYSSISYTVR